MCQDENENKPEDESLDKDCDKRTRPQYYNTLKDRFVQDALAPEQTKALVFVFIFVLAHEQAM